MMEILILQSQFHYGSIKTLIAYYPFIEDLKESQFHYGSIKTVILSSRKQCSSWSQFHYGSIKTFGKI